MDNKDYYKTMAAGAAVATLASTVVQAVIEIGMYVADPVTCPELKETLRERRDMVAKGFTK